MEPVTAPCWSLDYMDSPFDLPSVPWSAIWPPCALFATAMQIQAPCSRQLQHNFILQGICHFESS